MLAIYTHRRIIESRKGASGSALENDHKHMKTIIIRIDELTGNIIALEEIMKGALRWGYTFNNETIVFNSKKETVESCKKYHLKRKDYIFIMLNKTQLKCVDFIKNNKTRYCIALEKFLNIN